jgi:membrane protease YdiL (CAAX protease family)
MPEPVAVNLWVLALTGLAITAGGLVWIAVLVRWIRDEPIFKFEPRLPVPWGAGASLVAVMMALIPIWNVTSGVEQPNFDEIPPLETAKQIAGSGFLMLLITAVAVTLIGVTSRASWRDFGLPSKVPELIRDVKFGGLAWLATLIPVYGIHALLIYLLGQPSAHPLLKLLLQEPTPVLIVAGFLVAVIVAPISEELAFRLLLQSCLEKWETARVAANSMSLDTDINSGPEEASDAPVSMATQPGPGEPAYSQPAFLLTTKPTRGVGGLPYGWVPIAVSSFLFALAHLGHGPDPIAIFVLAIILGYTYQQTHRVIPCIITHMLFNALSLGMLLMQILHEPGGP